MKKWLIFLTCLLSMVSTVAYGAINSFVSGSTGADGAFSPVSNTVVTLPASGVLNYTTINIPTGVTVTFVPNAANSPIYMLATGNVTINGAINVTGGNATTSVPGVGGPGGYGGGYSYTTYNAVGGSGLGPGGGPGSGLTTTPSAGIAGSYAGVGNSNSPSSTYGNVNILPLIGGSGGGGGYYYSNPTYNHGGGGGGAVLVASSGTITFNGSLLAKGGVSAGSGGAGSAGAIKLMANTITGNGTIDASSATGGTGRVRLECYQPSYYGTSNPMFSYGIPGSIFGSAPPSIAITSIGGINPPAVPTGSFVSPDITLPSTTTNPVPVNITATNIPVGTTFSIRVIPQQWKTTTVATDLPAVTTTLTGTQASSSGSVNVTIPTTCSATVPAACTSVIVVQATFAVIAFNYHGEEVDQIRVASTSGGTSEFFYITKSGKEIKAS